MATKIYLAGSCSSEQRTMMTKIAKMLRSLGYEVYCPFELKIEDAWSYTQEDWAAKVFIADMNALRTCDIFLMITPGRISTAGSNWEQGCAYASNKPVIVFQYTDEPTSLMTFCGCTRFINTSIENIVADVKMVMESPLPIVCTPICKTTLT